MQRPPRDIKRDRLATPQSLTYSYLVCGFTIAATCFLAYLLAFTSQGVSMSRLGFSTDNTAFWAPPPRRRTEFPGELFNATRYATDRRYASAITPDKGLSPAVAASLDGHVLYPPLWLNADGRVLDARKQWRIYQQSQSAWYLTLVVCQFWHIWCCRTRTESIFSHGLFANLATLYGCVAELAIACFVVYLPAFHNPQAFQTAALKPLLWAPQFAFGAFIFAYNEAVKACVRRRPHGWVARYLQW
jgi:magnesium-transporting ATPase (P-type)